ncbi:uncharacterized protein LOC117171684 isoform X2 [Belonocnema kinseyi]|uniref:uncharacterized protein LOC117171684 isoform X2 n=1 Tax=Belonocnema kinseyi TaxID=2817044 RepID=UPI00143D8D77|nr:uncharacterized protein LOC117171684 isoform X2 [Belonocnema kinseyi]
MKKLTERQKSVLVDFITNNVNLIWPKVTNYVNRPDRLDAQNLWKQIAEELNGMPGPTKSWRQWRKSWQYVYRFARQNLATLQKRAKIGTLTDTQMNLLNLISLKSANHLSLDSTDNDIAENLSDDDDVFLEEEWLEDIDVNDKESEIGKIDKPHFNIQELKAIPTSTSSMISTSEKNVLSPETSNSTITKICNPQENIGHLEPSTSQKRNKSDTDCLEPSVLEVSKISSDQHFRIRKRDLSFRETELNSRERELSSRERELAFRETELNQQISYPFDRERELINRERELIYREREVIRRERELISREGHMFSLNSELLNFESKLILRAKEIEHLKKKVRDRMEKRMKFDSSFLDISDENDC